MLRTIINWVLSCLPVSRKTFYSELKMLRVAIKTLKLGQTELNSLPVDETDESNFAYLGNVQTRVKVNDNIAIVSYDLKVSKNNKLRSVTPFCSVVPREVLFQIISMDTVFMNILRPWVMGAPDSILLTHLRFGPDNPELPEHYQKFVSENNDAARLLSAVLKDENK